MQVETKVYFASKSREHYLEFFQKLFDYANSSRESTSTSKLPHTDEHFLFLVKNNFQTASNPPDVVKETTMCCLNNLMSNEPENVRENVTREWMKLDSHIDNLASNLGDAGVDQPSEKINLAPDGFDSQVDNLLRIYRSSIN